MTTYTGDDLYTAEIGDTRWLVLKRYQNLRIIGKGTQGIVCAAHDILRDKQVSIQRISRPFQKVDAKRIYREFKLMKLVHHQNLMGLLNAFTPQHSPELFDEFYMVMELWDVKLLQLINVKLDHEQLSYLLYQILCGIRHIHAEGIIHHDLNPTNIAVKRDCTLKILDFGSTRSFGETPYAQRGYYQAPELILGMPHEAKVDVWSIGCIFGGLVSRRVLFPGIDHIEQWTKIVEVLGTPSRQFLETLQCTVRSYVESRPSHQPVSFELLFPDAMFPRAMSNSLNAAHARNLLSRMLAIDPKERISVDEAIQHPYLNVWIDPKEVLAARSGQCNIVDDKREHPVNEWKTLIYNEIVQFEKDHNIYGEKGSAKN